jgi:RNA polymerase sigma factor (sigma-70 family)
MRDDSELDRLYRVHGPAVFRRARRILGRDADAHEVLQDVFLSLFEHPEQYAGRSELTTFLYSVTTHACLNRIRNQKNRARLHKDQVEPAIRLETKTTLDTEQRIILHHALQAMPEALGQAAVYYLVDGLTHQEIADIMQCSRRHVGDLLERVEKWGATSENSPC